MSQNFRAVVKLIAKKNKKLNRIDPFNSAMDLAVMIARGI